MQWSTYLRPNIHQNDFEILGVSIEREEEVISSNIVGCRVC
jgi:hypothetical protein